jgi:CCR4-NOT transcription complex subunit 1
LFIKQLLSLLFKFLVAEHNVVGDGKQVAVLFDEWARICDSPGSNDKGYAVYLSQLQHLGMLKGDDSSDRFFRILVVCDLHILDSGLDKSVMESI